MTTTIEPVDLDINQVRVIVQGMVRVAGADGIHERELALIREFYDACRADVKGLADFDNIQLEPFDPAKARKALNSEPLQQSFLASCYLLAYADGVVSQKELDEIDVLVRELGIGEEIAKTTRDLIKDILVMQLAKSENLEALQKISSEL
jgi:tellurite resistance protein